MCLKNNTLDFLSWPHISKPHVQILSSFLHMLSVAVARSSSDGNAIYYVLPVLWMTSCFYIVEQMDRIRDDSYASSSSGGSTGDEVCNLRLLLVLLLRLRNKLRITLNQSTPATFVGRVPISYAMVEKPVHSVNHRSNLLTLQATARLVKYSVRSHRIL